VRGLGWGMCSGGWRACLGSRRTREVSTLSLSLSLCMSFAPLVCMMYMVARVPRSEVRLYENDIRGVFHLVWAGLLGWAFVFQV